MRATRGAIAVVAMALCAFAGGASASTRISNPRSADPKIDRPDSLLFARSEFGVLLGSPAILNVEAGFWPHRIWGVRASGFYWGGRLGAFQGNLCMTLGRRRLGRHALALVGGAIHGDDNKSWVYGGLAWDANWGPLFTEFGQVIGRGNLLTGRDEPLRPALILQIGLMGGGGLIGPR